jgi:hypothetical protein
MPNSTPQQPADELAEKVAASCALGPILTSIIKQKILDELNLASLIEDRMKAVKSLAELRDAVKRTVNLDDCGHADGVSLILVDAVKNADEVLNISAPQSVKQ